MSTPFVGEIRIFAGTFAPAGWAFCDGQLLSIAENEVLFTLIGTTYGGDGQETFALPDLRGRLPLHQGSGFVIGELGGAESATLTVNQMPPHTHALIASANESTAASPLGSLLAQPAEISLYLEDAPSVDLNPAAIGAVGGSEPHSNLQPFVCVYFIISLFGIFPTQS